MLKKADVLSGKTVLVTGAAKRLGRAVALAAAENGAKVAITYRESAREARLVVGELARRGAADFLLFEGKWIFVTTK